jgi:hypothetical protein
VGWLYPWVEEASVFLFLKRFIYILIIWPFSLKPLWVLSTLGFNELVCFAVKNI